MFISFLSYSYLNIKEGRDSRMNFYGLFGQALAHSISPQIHQKIYDVTGIEAAYKKFETPKTKFTDALEAMKVLDIKGANVTIPYKEDVIPLLNTLSPVAKKLQSVNTIKNHLGKLEGYNTDYDGIVLTFKKKHWSVENKTAYVLGSGGASHAMAHFLNDYGAAKVTIVSRTPEKLKGPWEYTDYKELTNRSGDFIVNSTPVGMYPNVKDTPVDERVLVNFNYVFDMTYNPVETQFLQIANRLGKDTVNGLNMLVGQAIHSVQIWENQTFTEEEIDEILDFFHKNWNGVE